MKKRKFQIRNPNRHAELVSASPWNFRTADADPETKFRMTIKLVAEQLHHTKYEIQDTKYKEMHLIVGLGNPEKEYEKTRHNAGFMIVDQFQKELKFEPFHEEKKFQADISIGEIKSEKIIIAKPLTFMNLSGEAASKILQFYKIPFGNCIVAYDDLDLPLGALRIRKKGSAGSHNGMKSIISLLNNENFPRLRFGIESRGLTAPQQQETTSFVLSPFLKTEEETLQEALKKASEALKTMITDGVDKAMNQYN